MNRLLNQFLKPLTLGSTLKEVIGAAKNADLEPTGRIDRLVHPGRGEGRTFRTWPRPKLRLPAPLRPRAVAINRPVSLYQRSASGRCVLDGDNLHMVVLDAAVCLQADRQSATGGAYLCRITRLHLVVRSLLLRWSEFAVPALADYQPPARLFLPVRASSPCCRIIHRQHSWFLLGLSPVGISRTRSSAATFDGRLDIHSVGDNLYVLDGDLLRQYDCNAIRS